jgi:C4-dicarboxylate-specific signal transduction histidine kinase
MCPDGKIEVTHTYAAPGIEPFPKGVANPVTPWMTEQFAAGRTVVLSNIPDDLPAAAIAEREYFLEAGLRAGIGIPIAVAGSLVCVLSFGMFRRRRAWPAELVSRLRLAGDMFANAIVRRNAKMQLEQKQHELTHVTRVAHIGELAAVIAHELDQPLTAIVSNAEAVRYMLQTGGDMLEVDEALTDVVDCAMRVSEIVQRERRLLRKSHVSFEAVDLNEVVREIELFIHAEVRQARGRAVFELVPGIPLVDGDRVQLQQVILNLARNAVQAMRDEPCEKRELMIRTAAVSGEVTLSISDSGPPADEAKFKKMFEPFYTTKPGGLGMGLSISKSILDAHRGRIWADRNPSGRGITMNIAIPRSATSPLSCLILPESE